MFQRHNRHPAMPPPKVLDRPAADMRTKLATATRWAAQRPRTNQQGIALQTVIVIVVMLVIAGGVSGVLLSRGSEVIGDLENQNVGSVTPDTCETVEVAGEIGVGVGGPPFTSCRWRGTATAGLSGHVSQTQCNLVPGNAMWTANTSATPTGTGFGECILTF